MSDCYFLVANSSDSHFVYSLDNHFVYPLDSHFVYSFYNHFFYFLAKAQQLDIWHMMNSLVSPELFSHCLYSAKFVRNYFDNFEFDPFHLIFFSSWVITPRKDPFSESFREKYFNYFLIFMIMFYLIILKFIFLQYFVIFLYFHNFY